MDNIIVRYIPLPKTVNAMTSADPEGDYNVYINSHISASKQKKAFDHELYHIAKGHFYSGRPIAECEAKDHVFPFFPFCLDEILYCF